jgi:GNAT superfamily N-acetyltransferase
LELRVAGPEDALDVAAVHVRSWQSAYRGLLSDAYLDSLRPEERAARYTFGATGVDVPVTTVAIEEGSICGFVTTGPCRDDDAPEKGEVLALYVDPPAWGSGIGRRLLADARARLVRAGFGEAVLWVHARNDRARRFYVMDGWRPDDRQRSAEVWGVVVDEVRLRRPLP